LETAGSYICWFGTRSGCKFALIGFIRRVKLSNRKPASRVKGAKGAGENGRILEEINKRSLSPEAQ
jgi:hypothetical protein